MNFPSTEFSDAVSGLCAGVASDRDVAALHALLRSDQAARDDYLWQVELHARLAERTTPATALRPEPVEAGEGHQPSIRRLRARAGRRLRWAAAVAASLAVVLGGVYAVVRHLRETPKKVVTMDPRPTTSTTPPASVPSGEGTGSAGATAGVYRETVRFAMASDAPVIVGTGRAQPVALGSEVPYADRGDTLHVWDWSKSPFSRVMKETRLWPDDLFAVSPDGKTLVWAGGKVLDLITGEPSKIDLGGEHYLDDAGGQMRRIQQLRFTPDGRSLALVVSNVVLTPSTHPLRKQDFGTKRTIQIVTWPAGELACEFPAGLGLAFSADGKRAVSAMPPDEAKQRIVEYSAVTGEVLRTYEPPLREFAYAIAMSPDASRLAAFDSAGELLIWDSTTGELKHRVPLKESSPMDLRFSPDGKLVAISLVKMTSVIDVPTGRIVAAVPQEVPGQIRWSADNRAFDLISSVTNVAMTERRDKAGQMNLYNVFPTLTHWKIDGFRKE